MRDTEDRLIFLLRVIFLADTCGFAIICNQYINRYVFICNNVFLLLFLSLNLSLVCTQFAKRIKTPYEMTIWKACRPWWKDYMMCSLSFFCFSFRKTYLGRAPIGNRNLSQKNIRADST